MVAIERSPDILSGLEERERIAPVGNGIELAYDQIGDPDGEPILLIMGLSTQLVHWDESFCGLLAERGYRVIRFDNRDVGHSTKLDSAAVPGTAAMMLGLGRPAYRLRDLADDTAGLMDHLEIERAHLVGASMGGMIAQSVAIGHPDRVLSLASIMSTTGNRMLRMPTWRAFGTVLAKPARGREAYADRVVKTFSVIGSPDYPTDPEWLRAAALAAYDRCFHPRGVARQLHAINASGDRTRRLRQLDVPTVVIHGTRDPLVRPANARAAARAIPGARLRMIEGMGHDLPPGVWPVIIDEIDVNARRAREREPAAEPAGG